ncbi:uncharacterized protein LOC125941019 [Dermacentor silvarum]|uniref:uncharacterized protein LOC125941019 n=1 Tax=Dermacentor silvarum TaxID=543639 RepID=UPI002101CE30|nr:uncharacterized protein LOC125941019 [Dermacentor silvarum]
MVILEEINESSPIAEHACSGFYDGYEIGEDESGAPVQPLFDSITFDELLWQEEPTEGVLPAEPSYIGCYDDMVEEEEWNEDVLSAEDSGIVCNADTSCREDRNEDDLYAEHSDMLFIADMVETEEPSEGNLLIDCDVIVGNADILETEDERSRPWEQPSFRCSPSDEEPCEGSFPAEHTGIVGNACVTETEEPCEGTLPVDHNDIMGNTDVLIAQEPSESSLVTWCSDVLGNADIVQTQAVKRRKTKRRNKKRRRRPNSETQGSTSQHGSCQLGQAPEDSHCQPDMKYQSGDFCADVSDPPLPSCGCPGPFNEAVKRRKANRPNKKRRKRLNTETQGSTPQHGSGQLGQATEYSHCQPDLKYQSGDSGADVSGAPLPSTSQNGFHQTCGPASFHFTVFL